MSIDLKRLIFGMTISAVALTGCNKGPDLTDKELLTLLHTKYRFGSDENEHPTIARRDEQCVRMISGVDNSVYKDMPADQLGMMKSGCRQSLKEYIDDTKRNPKGVTLEDMERTDFALQVSKVRNQADIEEKAARDEEQKQEAARKLAENEKKISDFRILWQDVSNSVESRLAELKNLCEQYDAEKIALHARNKWAVVVPPSTCDSTYGDRVKTNLSEAWTQIEKVKPNDSYLAIPRLFYASPEQLDEDKIYLQTKIEEMKNVKALD